MFINIADKSAIIISFLSFVVFSFGLTGIYLFLNSIFNPDLFIQNTGSHLNSITDSKLTGNNKTNYNYFNSQNAQNNGQPVRTNPGVALVYLYEKRKNYVLLIFFALLLTVFFIIFKNIFLAFFIAIMSSGVLNEFICGLLRKRKETLDIQLIEFITNTIIMLKAGKEIRQIFKESIVCIKNPLKNHIKNLVSEVELNISMDIALDNFALNIGGKEVNLLANAIKINRKIGGNLLFILENIIKTYSRSPDKPMVHKPAAKMTEVLRK